ncbi:hypothetical protein TRICI_003265 [Trichomonascus ciferrii]|uniref:Uncharacterized protein n=1 Tax=Trichomonascus ciferrii TaxID=44093 RepID=A0A642V3N5_9ASCO|nr:hypothetical protein TRICI_003265 [Trichomonascus ciferrii]
MARINEVKSEEAQLHEKSDKVLKQVWLIGKFWEWVFVFVFAAVAYGVSVYKKSGHSHKRLSTLTLLQFQSFQYGVLALLWLISKRHLLKVVPYLIYSILQIANFYATNIAKDDKKADIESKLQQHGNKMERIVADCHIALWLRLLSDVIMLVPDSGVSILIFSFFFRLSMEHEPTQSAMDDLEEIIDDFMMKSFVPKAVQGKWKRLQNAIADYNSYQLTPDVPEEPEEKPNDKPNGKPGTGANDTTTLMNGN